MGSDIGEDCHTIGIKAIFKAPLKIITAPFKLAKKGVDVALSEIIFGLIRHALTSFGGAAVASGWITSSQVTEGIGALMTLIGIIWSIYSKRKVA